MHHLLNHPLVLNIVQRDIELSYLECPLASILEKMLLEECCMGDLFGFATLWLSEELTIEDVLIGFITFTVNIINKLRDFTTV